VHIPMNRIAATAVLASSLAGAASAAEILVSSNISVSTTWTANNTYNLQQQIYVLPGATLTIEPGTILASTTNLGGSLAVCRGAQIFVNGTPQNPVIMTSKADVLTWTGTQASPFVPGDPRTGVWREACNEWGNLTIMGRAYVSENAVPGNTPTPNPNNIAPMEGLVGQGPNDPNVFYGGGNDDDDSGSITYLSVRYGGRVIGLNNELNGISLGGIGRGTEMIGIDIMNNVDDGIEIWGGTLNLKYFNIWNIGDDSFDLDQGWRGKAQFGLIVQGYSVDAPSGSGVCDNALELDGAEDSDWQPVTTIALYNLTVLGQPIGGDHGTAWRDNARVQIRNSIFMDLGLNLVHLDNVDGDGGSGYGHNGTLTWAQTWTTNWNAVPPHANDGPPGLYTAQVNGKLAEITDSVFFRNLAATAYNEPTARGVTPPNATNNNVLIPGFDPNDAPVTTVTRGPAVVKGGRTMLPVTFLDPTPKNAATTSVGQAPNDGFFTPANYRGAFAPNAQPWVCSWTASSAFGFTPSCTGEPGAPVCFGDGSGAACGCNNNASSGQGCRNSTGTGAVLTGSGVASLTNDSLTLVTTQIPNSPGLTFQANNLLGSPSTFGDGIRCCGGNVVRIITVLAQGNCASTDQPAGCGTQVGGLGGKISEHPGNAALQPGTSRCYQHWYRDPGANNPCQSNFFNLSNAYLVTWGA
jgi:hypothetical protein